MLRAIPGPLLTEWMGYYLSPASFTTTDRLLAQLCAMTFNVNREKDAAPKSPEDFLPRARFGTVEERRRRARMGGRRGVEGKLKVWAHMKAKGES